MARPPGTRDDPPVGSLLFSARRLVGFMLLSSAGLLLVAAVVLLPAYERLTWTRHHQAEAQAETQRLEAIAADQQRRIEAAQSDRTYVTRLAMRQGILWPRNETVVVAPASPTPAPPEVIAAEKVCPLPPPDGPLLRWAAKLRSPAQRRGMVLLAAAAILAAMVLFSAPGKYGHPKGRKAATPA